MIREMNDNDSKKVLDIYNQALIEGRSTFNTDCPTYAEWDACHIKDCRFVCEKDEEVIGWTAISHTSSRKAYSGVVEVSVYIDKAFQSKGIGTLLLTQLCDECKSHGYWSLYSAIFPVNKQSIALHKKCGFREVGYREKIAKDRFGCWQDTVIMEKRIY